MILAPTFFSHTARRFTVFFLIAAVIVSLLLIPGILLELLRRTTHIPNISNAVFLEMALLALPPKMEEALPATIFCTALAFFLHANQTLESIATRTLAISPWHILTTVLIPTLAIGIFAALFFNPLAAASYNALARIEGQVLQGQTSTLDINKTGLWMRTPEPPPMLIHALRFSGRAQQLHDCTLYAFDENGTLIARIDTPLGVYNDGLWVFHHARQVFLDPSQPTLEHRLFTVPAPLSPAEIENRFSQPRAISFWNLPNFIRLTQAAGFNVVPHQNHFSRLLTLPLFLATMTMIGFLIATPPSSKPQTTWRLLSALGVLLLINVMHTISEALTATEALSPTAAALLTPIAGSAALIAYFLHAEET